MQDLISPFGSRRDAEKLTGAKFQNRYSIRLSDGYRAIFDLVEGLVIYRALANHEPSYRRAERLPAPSRSGLRIYPSLPSPVLAVPMASIPRMDRPDSFDPFNGPTAAADENLEIGQVSSDRTSELESAADQFVLFSEMDDLKRALSGELAEWMLFLPDAHRSIVTKKYNGPARVFGPSGTGKTCILLHRAVHLARTFGEPVLVLSFGRTLANVMTKLKDRLCGDDWELADRIRVSSLHQYAQELVGCRVTIGTYEQEGLIDEAYRRCRTHPATLLNKVPHGHTPQQFVGKEITDWVKGAAYGSAEIYQSLDFPKASLSLVRLSGRGFSESSSNTND